MNILALCGIAIIATVLTLTMRRHNSEISFLVMLLGCIFILLSVITATANVFEKIKSILDASNINHEYLVILVKAVGICFITEFSTDCCKDAGLSALANNISMAGKLMVLITALPLFQEILDFSLQLINVS